MAAALLRSIDRVLVIAALIRIAVGLSLVPASGRWDQGVVCAACALVGIWLYVGQRRDEPARLLAITLIIGGSAFTTAPLHDAPCNGPVSGALRVIARSYHLDAFVAWTMWRLIERLPAAVSGPRMRRVLRAGQVLSLAFAVAVEGGLAFRALAAGDLTCRELDPAIRTVVYPAWALLALACAVFLLRYRRATRLERTRARTLLLALAALPPILLVATTVPQSLAQRVVPLSLGLFLLFVGLIAYMALTQPLLSFRRSVPRLLGYRALQLALWVAALLPVALLVLALDRLASGGPWTGPDRALVLSLLIAVLVAPGLRRGLLSWLERRFETEEREPLTWLPEAARDLRRQSGGAQLVGTLRDVLVDRCGARDAHLWLVPGGPRVDGLTELESDSGLIELFDLRWHPFNREAPDRYGTQQRLTASDRELLDRHDIALLAAVRDLDGRTSAVLGVGAKRNELPYRDREVQVVELLADACTPALERLHRPPRDAEEGRLCVSCRRLFDAAMQTCPRCGVALATSDAPVRIGDRFQLLSQLGCGSFASVYSARDLRLHRPVAIKMLDSERNDHGRLAQEATAGARLAHAHVATVHGLVSWHGRRLLITELMEGGTLHDRLAGGPLSEKEVLEMARSLADALRSAHDLGFQHRDIKPSNIGFTADGTPKLIDLGLASLLSETGRSGSSSDPAPLTATRRLPGGALGTPLYASPEVFAGVPAGNTDDLWSLAVVLYEALTGENPFARGDLGAVRDAVVAAAPADPRELVDCSAELAALLRRALSPVVTSRFVDAEELLDALAQAAT